MAGAVLNYGMDASPLSGGSPSPAQRSAGAAAPPPLSPPGVRPPSVQGSVKSPIPGSSSPRLAGSVKSPGHRLPVGRRLLPQGAASAAPAPDAAIGDDVSHTVSVSGHSELGGHRSAAGSAPAGGSRRSGAPAELHRPLSCPPHSTVAPAEAESVGLLAAGSRRSSAGHPSGFPGETPRPAPLQDFRSQRSEGPPMDGSPPRAGFHLVGAASMCSSTVSSQQGDPAAPPAEPAEPPAAQRSCAALFQARGSQAATPLSRGPMPAAPDAGSSQRGSPAKEHSHTNRGPLSEAEVEHQVQELLRTDFAAVLRHYPHFRRLVERAPFAVQQKYAQRWTPSDKVAAQRVREYVRSGPLCACRSPQRQARSPPASPTAPSELASLSSPAHADSSAAAAPPAAPPAAARTADAEPLSVLPMRPQVMQVSPTGQMEVQPGPGSPAPAARRWAASSPADPEADGGSLAAVSATSAPRFAHGPPAGSAPPSSPCRAPASASVPSSPHQPAVFSSPPRLPEPAPGEPGAAGWAGWAGQALRPSPPRAAQQWATFLQSALAPRDVLRRAEPHASSASVPPPACALSPPPLQPATLPLAAPASCRSSTERYQLQRQRGAQCTPGWPPPPQQSPLGHTAAPALGHTAGIRSGTCGASLPSRSLSVPPQQQSWAAPQWPRGGGTGSPAQPCGGAPLYASISSRDCRSLGAAPPAAPGPPPVVTPYRPVRLRRAPPPADGDDGMGPVWTLGRRDHRR
eukprot:TRINITY_DN3148_c0_g2_i10.p1 TRINITY_DN3148_c0_g2~~TRINITY_DN3148_c0_g2_i10.p1  ORF type:complete len:742 (+),score=113.81 TRINITY_DN3148_c0_g2_i10:65-2290(+)